MDGALVSHTSLDAAVATLRASAAEYLPVRADGDGAAVIGFVDERQLLAAHNRVLEEARRG